MPMTVSPIAIAGLIPVPPAHTCVGSTYLCRQYLRPCLRVPDRFDVYAQAPQYHRLSSFSCFVLCSPPALHCAAHVKILPIKCSPQSGVCSKESRRQRDQSPRVVYIMNSPRPPFPPHVAMSLQSLSVAPRQSHLRFCQPTSSCVLNADIFSSIIQLTDPTTVAQCRLVSHAFDRLSIPILVRSVALSGSGDKAISFCEFMLEGSGRAFLLSIQQLFIHPSVCHVAANPSNTPTVIDRFTYLVDSLLAVINAARELRTLRFVACSELLLKKHDPDLFPESTPHQHLSYLELEYMSNPVHPAFLFMHHLSLAAYSLSPSLESELRSLTLFPALRSFSGPTSAFIALSFQHALEVIRLHEYYFRVGRPAWIRTGDDVDDVLSAISRVPARSIAIGVAIPGGVALTCSFWRRLVDAAPHLEILAATLSYDTYVIATTLPVRLS